VIDMSFEIISMGALLVEIIRKELGKPFREASDFAGPFPSGDTPIFINAAAKLGRKCGFIGSCGDDEFGDCVYDRMLQSGVDMQYVSKIKDTITGTTFVAYEEDGTRQFLYHLRNSGSAVINIEDVSEEYFKNCKWVHYTAFNLEISDSVRSAVYKSLQILDDKTRVSFDPNIRFELCPPAKIRELCEPIMRRADLLMPSQFEFQMMYGKDDHQCCMEWMQKGKTVILKMADKGCRIYDKGEITDIPPFKTVEIDATGAGDIFCAAFIHALLEGRSFYEAGRYANAAGAFSVMRMGPMEGTVTKEDLDDFLATNSEELF
jgi:tagatose kinase